MSDESELQTVQSFPSWAEAELARGMLTDAGIKAAIFEGSIGIFMGGCLPFGALQVKVFDEDIERAKRILALEPWDDRIDWSDAERFASSQIVADEVVPPELSPTTITTIPAELHPDRMTNTPGLDRIEPGPTTFSVEPIARTVPIDNLETGQRNSNEEPAIMEALPVAEGTRTSADREPELSWADSMTNRAYRASWLGILVFPPMAHIYSVILLLNVAFSGKKTSPAVTWKFYVALVVNVIAFAGSISALYYGWLYRIWVLIL